MRSRLAMRGTEIFGSLVAIGLVATFALPMLANGHNQAQRSTCLQNMKQIGASVMLYAASFDGVLPRTSQERPKLGLGAHWTYLVQPFVRSKDVFVCPADEDPGFNSEGSTDTKFRVPLYSYINNYAAIPAHDFYPVAISSLGDPAGLILLGERRHHTERGLQIRSWKGTSGFVPGQPCSELAFGRHYMRTTVPMARQFLATARNDKDLLLIRVDWNLHGAGSNFTFADGHAKFATLEQTLAPQHFAWGERFYPRSMPDADCDGRSFRRKGNTHDTHR